MYLLLRQIRHIHAGNRDISSGEKRTSPASVSGCDWHEQCEAIHSQQKAKRITYRQNSYLPSTLPTRLKLTLTLCLGLIVVFDAGTAAEMQLLFLANGTARRTLSSVASPAVVIPPSPATVAVVHPSWRPLDVRPVETRHPGASLSTVRFRQHLASENEGRERGGLEGRAATGPSRTASPQTPRPRPPPDCQSRRHDRTPS